MSKVDIKNFITDAKIIMNTDYPPTRFIVKDILPSTGLAIIAGPSKAGKSLFTTQLLNSVAGNCDCFLGHEIETHGEVLYLALEDSASRIKERLLKQKLPVENSNFKMAFDWSKDENAISDLDSYLTENPKIILVVIDTKGKLCKEQGTQVSYQGEYNFMGLIKDCADKHGICITVITHLRKRPSQEDIYNEINGTSAIMGSADTILILKRPRNQNRGILSLTGRDFPEREEEIFFDYETLTWKSLGENQNANPNMTPERLAIINAMKSLGKPCKPSEIAEVLGKDNKVVGNLLAKMQEYYFVKKSSQKHGYWLLPEWEDEEIKTSETELEDIF